MTHEDLLGLRKTLGLTQPQMADLIGLSERAYQDIEAGKSALRKIHTQSLERGLLDLAIDHKNIAIAPAAVRKAAIELARMITEG